jgi:hypothetical protein
MLTAFKLGCIVRRVHAAGGVTGGLEVLSVRAPLTASKRLLSGSHVVTCRRRCLRGLSYRADSGSSAQQRRHFSFGMISLASAIVFGLIASAVEPVGTPI